LTFKVSAGKNLTSGQSNLT